MKSSNFIKEPLLHFALIGALIFLLFNFIGEQESPENLIVVTQAEIEGLKQQWKDSRGSDATEEDIQLLINTLITERVLASEARSLNLDQHDRMIDTRLAQKFESLYIELEEIAEPTEEQLSDYYRENMLQFALPPKADFRQIFFDPQYRSDWQIDFQTVYAVLNSQTEMLNEQDDFELSEFGDATQLPHRYRAIIPELVARGFGRDFANQLFTIKEPGWHAEPLESSQGFHLVYLEKIEPMLVPEFDAVRDQVRQRWLNLQQANARSEFYYSLRDSYEIRVGEE